MLAKYQIFDFDAMIFCAFTLLLGALILFKTFFPILSR